MMKPAILLADLYLVFLLRQFLRHIELKLKSFLAMFFFELLTNIIVFQHVMKFVGEFQFPFESIVFYATDNVGYMLLSYKNALKGILLVQHSFQICPNLPLHTPLCYAVQLPLNDASRTTTSYWRMKDKV